MMSRKKLYASNVIVVGTTTVYRTGGCEFRLQTPSRNRSWWILILTTISGTAGGRLNGIYGDHLTRQHRFRSLLWHKKSTVVIPWPLLKSACYNISICGETCENWFFGKYVYFVIRRRRDEYVTRIPNSLQNVGTLSVLWFDTIIFRV